MTALMAQAEGCHRRGNPQGAVSDIQTAHETHLVSRADWVAQRSYFQLLADIRACPSIAQIQQRTSALEMLYVAVHMANTARRNTRARYQP